MWCWQPGVELQVNNTSLLYLWSERKLIVSEVDDASVAKWICQSGTEIEPNQIEQIVHACTHMMATCISVMRVEGSQDGEEG